MSFDHDRPDAADPNEWEWQCVTPAGATVLVSKVGGGMTDTAYAGHWHYSYSRRDYHTEGSDLHTGSPHTHDEVAGLVAELIEDY